MANIVVRKEDGRSVPAQVVPSTDLFAPIRDFVEPFRQFLAPFGELRPFALFPAFEIKENKDGYVIRADVPGVKEADLEVNVTGKRLSVSGKREEEKEERGETYYTSERSYGSFSRSFTLPEGSDVQHIAADLKGGVLTISVPKSAETKTKKVEIKGEQASKA